MYCKSTVVQYCVKTLLASRKEWLILNLHNISEQLVRIRHLKIKKNLLEHFLKTRTTHSILYSRCINKIDFSFSSACLFQACHFPPTCMHSVFPIKKNDLRGSFVSAFAIRQTPLDTKLSSVFFGVDLTGASVNAIVLAGHQRRGGAQ